MTETNEKIFEILSSMHPNAKCELDYTTPFELLVAVVLSAQCTDKRVNKVTSELFKLANTPEAFARMDVAELEKHIFSCGFYHNKAKAIKAISLSILEQGACQRQEKGLKNCTEWAERRQTSCTAKRTAATPLRWIRTFLGWQTA